MYGVDDLETKCHDSQSRAALYFHSSDQTSVVVPTTCSHHGHAVVHFTKGHHENIVCRRDSRWHAQFGVNVKPKPDVDLAAFNGYNSLVNQRSDMKSEAISLSRFPARVHASLPLPIWKNRVL